MTSSDTFSAAVEKLQGILQIPPTQLKKRAYRQLVEEELHKLKHHCLKFSTNMA